MQSIRSYFLPRSTPPKRSKQTVGGNDGTGPSTRPPDAAAGGNDQPVGRAPGFLEPGLMALVEGTSDADLIELEAGLEQTGLAAETVGQPAVVPIPVAARERVQAKVHLTNREKKALVPGKLNWRAEVKDHWATNHPWHEIVEEGVRRIRKSERKFDSPFATTGSINFKSNALSDHATSREHRQCVEDQGGAAVMEKAIDQAISLENQTAINLFQAAYWLAKKDVALAQYGTLLDLLKDTGAQVPSELYHNNKAAYQFIDAIAEAIMQAQKEALKQSPVVSIGIDESTDISVHQHMIVYCKYITAEKKVSTVFLGLLQVNETDAASLCARVLECLNLFGIPIEKVLCFGSDGASVMTGAQNGVAARLQRLFPFMLAIHCIAHRLNLAAGGAADSLPFAVELDKLVNAIAAVFSRSAKKLGALRELEEELGLPDLVPTRIFAVRWLSRNECLKKLCRVLPAVVGFMQQEDPAAYKQLCSFRVLHGLHMLADATSTLARLSKAFQGDHVDLTAIQGLVEGAKVELVEDFAGANGPAGPLGGFLAKFLEGLEGQESREERTAREQQRQEVANRMGAELPDLERNMEIARNVLRQGGAINFMEVQSYLGQFGELKRLRELELRAALDSLQPVPLTYHGHTIELAAGEEAASNGFATAWVEKVISNLEARFAEAPKVAAFGILAPDAAAFPSNKDQLATYGLPELKLLWGLYCVERVVDGKVFAPFVDCDYGTLRQEFRTFKQWGSTTFQGCTLEDTWSKIAKNPTYFELVPCLLRLTQ
ncbi:hypothetical protein KFL_014550010, partial [Klebsormidium nitens]